MFCETFECLHHAESTHLKQQIRLLEQRLSDWIEKSNDPKVDIATETAREYLGYIGAMISWSKSGYISQHQADLVVFNANVCIEPNKKIWWGDLNVTEKSDNLQKLANALHKNVFVLYEMDAFGNDVPVMDRPARVFVPELQ
jgi:hypothetical protein